MLVVSNIFSEQGVRFKAIGKAAIQGTKQIGKTLTAMSDSPDKRGRGKLAEVNAAQFSEREKRKRKSKRQSVVKATDQSLGLDTSELTNLSSFSVIFAQLRNQRHRYWRYGYRRAGKGACCRERGLFSQ